MKLTLIRVHFSSVLMTAPFVSKYFGECSTSLNEALVALALVDLPMSLRADEKPTIAFEDGMIDDSYFCFYQLLFRVII